MTTNADLVREVMDWARERLGGELSVSALAGRAGYSVHHFTRLFSAVAGLPPAEWIERERIAAAERLLAGTRLRVLDIALDCGFKDAATFSRAFQRVAGLSPSAYRAGLRPAGGDEGCLPAPVPGGLISSTRVEVLAAIPLAGLMAEVRGGADAGVPGGLWARLAREAGEAKLLPRKPEYYQLAFWEGDSELAFSCLAGFAAPGICVPLPFVSTKVPASLCLVCAVEGPPEAIGAAYAELYGRVLPASIERPALDFALERYPGPGKTEICLPLRLV